MNKTKLCKFCQTNGFSLKEYPLEGRLLLVLLPPKIIVKKDLDDKRKQVLVVRAISYLQHLPGPQGVVIFWEGEERFFPL